MHKEGLTVKELHELRPGCGSHVLMGGIPCHFGYTSLSQVEENTNHLYDNAILHRSSFGNTAVIDSHSNYISGDPKEMLDAAIRFKAGEETIRRLRCLAAAHDIWGDPEKVPYAMQLYALSHEEKERVADLHRKNAEKYDHARTTIDAIIQQLLD